MLSEKSKLKDVVHSMDFFYNGKTKLQWVSGYIFLHFFLGKGRYTEKSGKICLLLIMDCLLYLMHICVPQNPNTRIIFS